MSDSGPGEGALPSLVSLQERVEELERTVDRLERELAERSKREKAVQARYDPQFEAPAILALEPGQRVTIDQMVELVKQQTPIVDDDTADQRAKKILKKDDFRPTEEAHGHFVYDPPRQ